ncbi:MAG: hypothetical protein AB8B55_24695 [Mariniblastus sp.]
MKKINPAKCLSECFLAVGLFLSALIVAPLSESTAFAFQDTETANDAVEKDSSQLGSLLRVPQSTGLYFATMNHAEIYDAIFKSNAWKAIKNSEVSRGMKKAYRRGRTRGYEDYNEDNPFAIYLSAYGDSMDGFIANTVKEVGQQVVGNEIFLFIDNDAVPIFDAGRKMQEELYKTLGLNDLGGMERDFTPEDTKAIVDVFVKNFADVEFPTMMLGARLEDPEGFRGLLELARSGLEQLMEELPDELSFAKGYWDVVDEKKNYLMLIDVEMSELPWEEISDQIDDPESIKELQKLLSTKKMTLAMGIIDNLLMVGVGKNREKFLSFGDSPQLVDLPELAKLREAIDGNEALTSVVYTSKKFATLLAQSNQISDSQKASIRPIITALDTIPEGDKEEWISKLESDLDELAEDLASFQGEPSMLFGFTAMCDEGIRGYFKSEFAPVMLDGTAQLTLAKHAGPQTVGFLIQRPANLEDQFNFATKWFSKVYGYTKPMTLGLISESLQTAIDDSDSGASDTMTEDDVDAIMVGMETMFSSFAETTRDLFLPAIENQEAGLFLEMLTRNGPWHSTLEQLDESSADVPLPMPAIVVGTKDAEKVTKAMEKYASALDEMAEVSIKHSHAIDAEVYAHKIVSALKGKSTESGMSYRIDILGGELPDVQMGTLVTDDWIVMNLLPKQAVELGKKRDSNLFGPAATSESSLSLLFYDNQTMMNSMRPWLDLFESRMKEAGIEFNLSEYEADRDTLQFSEAQLREAFERCWDMGACWKGYSGRASKERDGMVTEFLLKFEDVPAGKE